MPTYKIVAPCAYPKDGRIVRHRRPGAEVEIDAATAKQLGKRVHKVTAKSADEAPADADAAGEAPADGIV